MQYMRDILPGKRQDTFTDSPVNIRTVSKDINISYHSLIFRFYFQTMSLIKIKIGFLYESKVMIAAFILIPILRLCSEYVLKKNATLTTSQGQYNLMLICIKIGANKCHELWDLN